MQAPELYVPGKEQPISLLDDDLWQRVFPYDLCTHAHDIIRNHFHYNIDCLQLVLMAAVVIGYFIFLFKASDVEYREVIDEKFNGK